MLRSCLLLGLLLAVASAAPAQYVYSPSPDYYRNDTAEGTVTGGALGAIAGALIGGSEGKSPEGALIGAGVGALTGNLLGRSKDAADERQAAQGFGVTARANAQAQARAVTNYDLIQMTEAGVSDSVIISAIHSRGGRFDLSPQGLIMLKQNGVSDSVVVVAQQSLGVPNPALSPAPVVVERPVYYHRPATRVYLYGRPGPRWGYHYHRHW